MDEVVEIDLDTKEQLVVVLIATAVAFAAEKLTMKGLTQLIKSRK